MAYRSVDLACACTSNCAAVLLTQSCAIHILSQEPYHTRTYSNPVQGAMASKLLLGGNNQNRFLQVQQNSSLLLFSKSAIHSCFQLRKPGHQTARQFVGRPKHEHLTIMLISPFSRSMVQHWMFLFLFGGERTSNKVNQHVDSADQENGKTYKCIQQNYLVCINNFNSQLLEVNADQNIHMCMTDTCMPTQLDTHQEIYKHLHVHGTAESTIVYVLMN